MSMDDQIQKTSPAQAADRQCQEVSLGDHTNAPFRPDQQTLWWVNKPTYGLRSSRSPIQCLQSGLRRNQD